MIAIVIPCYRVKAHVMDVIARVGPEVSMIYAVDDCCSERSGRHIEQMCRDPRVKVLFHQRNRGVGGAMVTGYRQALADGASVVVKIDGDGQMDPALLPRFVQPILDGAADYTKGNRFYDLGFLAAMPGLRLFGNSVLSFVSKAASGYWDVMDPTNGYTAVHAAALERLPLDKLDERYFFESDMLFRLNTIRAVVRDIPMEAHYEDESSSLQVRRVALEFPGKYLNRFLKRIFYNYFLRDFNAGTVEFVIGLLLLLAGTAFGLSHWLESYASSIPATSGTVMVAALPILLGFQLLISAANYDIHNMPKRCLQSLCERRTPPPSFSQGEAVAGSRSDHGKNRHSALYPQWQEIPAGADRIDPGTIVSALEAADP